MATNFEFVFDAIFGYSLKIDEFELKKNSDINNHLETHFPLKRNPK